MSSYIVLSGLFMRRKPLIRNLQEEAGTASDPGEIPCSTVHIGPAQHGIKRILVPMDFSESACKALGFSATIAQQTGARLILLNVVEPGVASSNYLYPTFDQTAGGLVEHGREKLLEVCRKKLGAHCDCDVLVRIGRAPSEIVDTAQALGADLIILGSQGQNGPRPQHLGSTAERVLRQATCPVLTVNSGS
jgi:nucleotide-binding universal stress UspA family protein